MGTNLETITSVIVELEEQANQLKNFTSVLKKIDELAATASNLIDSINSSSVDHKKIVLQLEARKNELNLEMNNIITLAQKTIDKIETRFSQFEKTISNKIDQMQNNLNLDTEVQKLIGAIDNRDKLINKTLIQNQEMLMQELKKLQEQIERKKGLLIF